MTDKEKFNSLLEFFIKQWEENAAQEGVSAGKAAYGNTWSGRVYDKFTNYGFFKDLVNINSTQLHFTFGPGVALEQNGRNYVNWEWLNIIPNITIGTRKILKLSTVAVQTRHYPKKCVSLKIIGFDFLIKVEPFFQI